MYYPPLNLSEGPPPYDMNQAAGYPPPCRYVCSNPDPPMMMAPVVMPQQQQQQQQQSSTNNTSNSTTVVVSGSSEKQFVPFRCPVCSVGVLEENFTCCGVFWAIVLFPIGIICLFLLRERSCSACGYSR